MTTATPTIALVDDDAGVRTGLGRLLREEGWNVQSFESAEAFLARSDPTEPSCLVLDVEMPGLDGLALQRRLGEAGTGIPVVFLTGRGDIPMSVRAIKAGAIDFLTKPVKSETLIAAIRGAMDLADQHRLAEAEATELRHRLSALTPREREVLEGLVAGRLNKQIAADLGVVEQTVKFHRSRIMERMRVRTVAELMHVAARAGVVAPAAREGTPADTATRRPG